jgi:acetyl-CoA acetyltransferase
VHAVDLSAHVLTALAGRSGVDPAVVEDVFRGCVSQVGGRRSTSAAPRRRWPAGPAPPDHPPPVRLLAAGRRLRRRHGDQRPGPLQTMCEGGGIANATVLELLEA